MISKLAKTWGIKEYQAEDVLSALDAKKWADGDLSAIKYAGTIDTDATADKMAGHTGYWIADSDEHIAFVTNGDHIWADWSEDISDDCGLVWGSFADSVADYRV